MSERKITLEYAGEVFEIHSYAVSMSKYFRKEMGTDSDGTMSVRIQKDKYGSC